jgi:hypothetical protein
VTGAQCTTPNLLEAPGLHAACTPPARAERCFCKHMVAAALVWRQRLGGDALNGVKAPKTRAPRRRRRHAPRTVSGSRNSCSASLRQNSRAALGQAQLDSQLMGDLKACRERDRQRRSEGAQGSGQRFVRIFEAAHHLWSGGVGVGRAGAQGRALARAQPRAFAGDRAGLPRRCAASAASV